MELEKYQVEGAKFLSDRFHALLADDMGLGKTAQTIKACEAISAKKILIICPASVKSHWKSEFEKWTVEKYLVDIVKTGNHNLDHNSRVTVINYELLLGKRMKGLVRAINWDVMVCDEAHYLKSLTSKRSKIVLGSLGIAKAAKRRWMLTGTPIENRPVDLFPMLYTLARKNLGVYNNYERFVMHFCDGYYDSGTGIPTPHGSSNEKELSSALEGFMLRRTLKETLPKEDIQIIRLEKNIEVERVENGVPENQIEAYTYKPMEELGALASLRQEVALAKLAQCVDYIRDTLKVVPKILVFAYHRSVIENLSKALGQFKPVKFYGGMTSNQKEIAKNIFIKDKKCKLLIGQLKAAGTGLDGLQHVTNHMIFVEIDWVPFKQCVGRLKRKGQKSNNVIVQILVCKDSIEENILGSVNSKMKSIDNIILDN